MVVDLGEADVLVGEQPQLFDGGLDAGRARRNGIEELAQFLLIDGATSGAGVWKYSERPDGLEAAEHADDQDRQSDGGERAAGSLAKEARRAFSEGIAHAAHPVQRVSGGDAGRTSH